MRYLSKREPVSVVDHLFENMFHGDSQGSEDWRSFAVDAVEKEKVYLITADLPGFTHKDLNIIIEDSVLIISASKEDSDKQESDSQKETYMIHERRGGRFRRTFELPGNARRDSVQANFKNGVLNLLVEKKEEAQPWKIQING